MNKGRGFSLVELLVALLLTGILMTGLSHIFARSFNDIQMSRESLGAQRRGRWSVQMMGDDVRMAGHTDGLKQNLQNLVAPPFRIIPGEVGAGGPGAASRDVLEFFLNEPRHEAVTVGDLATGYANMALRSLNGEPLDIQPGDAYLIRDGIRSEYGYFSGTFSGGLVPVGSDNPSPDSIQAQLLLSAPGEHQKGRRVMIHRPFQMVRYEVEERATDPADPTRLVPCLVRRQAPYSLVGAVDWAGVPGVLVAENVQSFRVDLSVNGGVNWTRAGAGTWEDIRGAANGYLTAPYQIEDTRFWFKEVSALLRLEIRTRTATERQEYAQDRGQAGLAFRERTQTLMITPRNFASPF